MNLKVWLEQRFKILPAEPVRLMNRHNPEEEGFPGVNIDSFPPLLMIALYQSYSDSLLLEWVDQLTELFPDHPILIQDRSNRPYSIRMKKGDIPGEMEITEGNLQFLLHPERGQNPGFFHDMRLGRNWIDQEIRKSGEDFTVLNLFAYTCALSVKALVAGASKVVNIDMNKRSLDIGRRNHRLNHSSIPGGFGKQALFLPHNIFKSFGKLKKEGPYNLIIADPPPSQKGSFDLKKDYPKLLRRLPEMLKTGGKLFLSLNSPGYDWQDFEEMVNHELPDFNIIQRLDPPDDFAPAEEGRGLKILICSH